MNYRDYYDKKEGAVELTRKLYKEGMLISDLLKKIDDERFFTPNKNRKFSMVKEDMLSMNDNRKDQIWRTDCLGYYLMECFMVSLQIVKLVMALWANIKSNNQERIDYYNNWIYKLIDEKRSKWDK